MSTCPNRPCEPLRTLQRGVSVFAAIFLLLLFALLAAAMSNLVSTSESSSAQDVLGTRAYQAAQAGVEWGLFQLDPNGDAAALPACFAAATLNQVPGYVVTVACDPFPGAATSYAEAGRSIRLYRITATARTNAAPVNIERVVSATIEKCRDPAVIVAPFDC